MRIPLIQIKQNNEYMYTSKMKVGDMKNYVKLNFRHPYISNVKDGKKLYEYIRKMENRGISVGSSEDGIQRQIQIERLGQIAAFIEEINNIIPNAIILGCYDKRIESGDMNKNYQEQLRVIDSDLGIFSLELNKYHEMIVIDGQHRLGGYFYSKKNDITELEVPVVILFGPSLSVASKIFIDINKNQKAVDSSMIYDLTAMLENEYDNYKLKGKEVGKIRDCHNIIKALNTNEKSPLYNNIRMLGTGEGVISQAFLVEIIYPIINNGVMKDLDVQKQLNEIYIFLKAIQRVFQSDWPILELSDNEKEEISHYNKVIKEKKSQLSKTLGMGAFFTVFPTLYKDCNGDYNKYVNYLERLIGKIVWSKSDYLEQKSQNHNLIFIEGTNRVAIKNLSKVIGNIIFDKSTVN